jgi:hypothetical protein
MAISAPQLKGDTSIALGLKENEERLVGELISHLEIHHPEDAVLVKERFDALRALGQTISLFPSVRSVQMVRGETRDEEQLLSALCAFAPSSHLLHVPTRIVAARSFFVAKCHAFSLLSIMVKDAAEFLSPVRQVIFSIICTLMTEEVYFTCLDDPSFPQDIKIQLAHDLITLWDSGTDPRAVQHLPALEALWVARDESPPSFGTMDGSSELLRVTFGMEDDWQRFLVDQVSNNETRWALEEFLFGLSYEDIQEVRSRLSRFGISAVGHDEVRSYLGSRPAYEIVNSSDPRAIFDFYVDRKEAALFRKRSAAPGPQKTLEEIYLTFRLLHG